ATILLEQSRPDLAEKELLHGLGEDPNDARAHALLALCLLARDDTAAATHEATLAVELDPGLGFAHYVVACVLHKRNYFGEALAPITEAIRIQPENAHYYAKLAQIRYDQRDWQSSLEAAEMGLRIDAED